MKNLTHLLLFCGGFLMPLLSANAQNTTLNPWAMSAPQMTNAQIMAIPNPQPGWMVYDTDSQCLRLYTNAANNPSWQCIGTTTQPGATGWIVSGFNPLFKDMAMTANALYLVGSYSVANNGIPASAGMRDVFVAKYSLAGVPIWFSRAGGTQMDEGTGIDVIGNEIFVSGNFNATADFGTTTITSAGGQDGFIAKLDDNGVWQWATAVGGAGNDQANAVARLRISSGVYGATICGLFDGTASFGSNSFTSAGGTDAFMANTSATGAITTAFAYGGPGNDVANDIFQGESISTSIIVGSFEQSMTVSTQTLTSAGGKDGFMIGRWNGNVTNYLCRRLGGPDDDEALKIVGTEKHIPIYSIIGGTIHIVGTFRNNATFDTNTGFTTVSSAGGSDLFDYTGQFNHTISWFGLSPKTAGGAGNETVTALTESSLLNAGGYQSVAMGATTTSGMIFGSAVVPPGPFVANWGIGNQGSWVLSGSGGAVGGVGFDATSNDIYGAINSAGTFGNATLSSPGVIKLF